MTDNDGISAETSNCVCKHMNEDHTVSIYAMAKSMLGSGYGKITDAKLKEVSMDGCNIAVVTCQGDRCDMKRLIYPFEPRLKSGAEVRSRMVAIHQQVCAPNPLWLVTHMDALGVLIVVALLGYGTHILGLDELATNIEAAPQLDKAISIIFGSASGFGTAVLYAWIIAVVLHGLEAIYVVYQARTALKLNLKAQILWFLTVSCVGYPITQHFLELLTVHAKQSKQSKKEG